MKHLPLSFISRQDTQPHAADFPGGPGFLGGFTLVELLVAMAVLVMMSFMMVSVISSAQKVSKQTTSRVEQFREARRGFERINERVSQATIHTYLDYVDSSGASRTKTNASNFTPSRYARISELRFTGTAAASLTSPHGGGNSMIGQALFFQAPLGSSTSSTLSSMNCLLNTVGYYIEKGSNSALLPPTVQAAKTRYRLFELTEATENLTIYTKTSGNSSYNGSEWFTIPLANPVYSHRLADNIVALLFQAEYISASGTSTRAFNYSSAPTGKATQSIEENNLPPSVHVTMIAVDEISASRIQDQNIMLPDAQNDDHDDPPKPNSLDALEQKLKDNRLNYRKVESTVSIGAAKWSSK